MRTRHSLVSLSLMALVAALIVSAALVLVSPVSASAPANRPQNIPTNPPPTSTSRPTERPTESPTELPQTQPTERPQEQPTDEPLPEPIPTARPTDKPKRDNDKKKDPTPTPEPSVTPLPEPSAKPIPQTNVRIIKEVDRAQAQTGETVVYRITVINTGDAVANDVVVHDQVPSAVEVTDLASSKGDIVVSGQTVTAYPSTLQPGEQASYTVTGRVREGATGSVENTALVTISTPGDDPSDNTSTVIFTIPAPQPKPQPTAPPQVVFRVPQTADPQDDVLWSMLPWALLAIALIGVGGLIAWSIASQRGLTQQLMTFMSQRALDKDPDGEAQTPHAVSKAAQAQINHPPLQPFISEEGQAQALPPLGPPFPPAPPLAPLPPPAALDRRKALQ
jgi:uncharacterized repeat protein (TIGR01451 family)